MARRQLSAKQIAAGFGGKALRRKSGRRVAGTKKPMPSRVRRAVARGRSYARRARSSGSRVGSRNTPGLANAIDGALGAVGARVGAQVSTAYGPGLAMAGVGYFRRNQTLTTLGTMSLIGAAIDGAGIPMLSGKLGATGVL